LLPHRNGNNWRPKATIVNEDDAGAVIFGNWEVSTITGFKPNILIKKDTSYASVTYYFNVPFDAWFDVFAYNITGPLATDQAPFTVYSHADSSFVFLNQKNFYNKGWQRLKSVYLTRGYQKVLKLDNSNVSAGQYVVADAAMIMINRKLSTEVIVTKTVDEKFTQNVPISNIVLYPNYPNPFNESTKIGFYLNKPDRVKLSIYNILGEKVPVLVDEFMAPGNYEIVFNAENLTSGIYFIKLEAGSLYKIQKLTLLR